jgi:hypothetical protein
MSSEDAGASSAGADPPSSSPEDEPGPVSDPSTLDPQPLSTASASLRSLVQKAQQLFDETYFCPSSPICAVAPGRVNLM